MRHARAAGDRNFALFVDCALHVGAAAHLDDLFASFECHVGAWQASHHAHGVLALSERDALQCEAVAYGDL